MSTCKARGGKELGVPEQRREGSGEGAERERESSEGGWEKNTG